MFLTTLRSILITVFLGLALVACNDQPEAAGPVTESAEQAAASTPELEIQRPQSITEEPTAPKATSPEPVTAAASPSSATASPAAQGQVTPEGTVTYVWHTAITPQWLDPQENPPFISPYAFAYVLHDAVVKHLPGEPLAPSLAESYDVADDFMSATFKLREGITFHNGQPVTAEDVKFTFENYRGANAQVLQGKTERIEVVDDRTVRFHFKEPFLDFLILYGSPASGAGWVVPKAYYEEVGPDGFKQNPIGAGPYKLVSSEAGASYTFEANPDYWRGTPHVKTIVIRSMPEAATRIAALQAGEVDIINLVPGQLLSVVQQDPNLELAPVHTAPFYLEFPGYMDENNPFHDKRVREAVSLALDRRAISEAEEGGFSAFEGNWIPEDWPGAISRPMPEHNLERAKQLMAEAGYPDGFEVEQLTPLPNYFSLGQRVISDLRQIGIRTQLNQMERGAFFEKLSAGPGALPGIILNISGAPGDAAARVRVFATCDGSSSRTCDPQIEEPFKKYEASSDPAERKRLIAQIQEYILDNYIYVPIYRQAFINAVGPRIANPWQEIIGAIPQYVYVGPYEDIELKP